MLRHTKPDVVPGPRVAGPGVAERYDDLLDGGRNEARGSVATALGGCIALGLVGISRRSALGNCLTFGGCRRFL